MVRPSCHGAPDCAIDLVVLSGLLLTPGAVRSEFTHRNRPTEEDCMTQIKITNRWNSSIVLFTFDVPEGMESGMQMRAALEAARGADLRDADLCGANLCDADLRDANLCGANLCDADLRGANLRGANLRDSDLCGANLRGADLRGANLRDADLCGANLCDANLCDANLRGADLCRAHLCDADLCGANLRGADLRGANLRGANLCDADLCGANLRGADLCGANLRGADLRDANLCGANLCGAKNAELAIACTRIVAEGSIIGYKKCRGGIIVKLRIPEEAKRSHAFGRKCRAEFVDVLEIYGATQAYSLHDNGETVYRVGERVLPDSWCEDYTQECAPGIHFFITKAEAEAH